MDLRRIRNNILNRKWSDIPKETNIKYLKRQLKQFGLEIPKYLKQGKLTNNSINALTNKLNNVLENKIEEERKNPPKLSYEKAFKQLEKVVKSHNDKVHIKLDHTINKYQLTENQVNYLIGRDVNTESNNLKYKASFSRANSQFQLIDLTNSYFSSSEAIMNRIKQIKQMDKRLYVKYIEKELKSSPNVIKQVNQMLQNYVDDNVIREKDKNRIMKKIKGLNGIQQEVFYRLLSGSTTKSKYVIGDDEREALIYNLNRKWDNIYDLADNF